MNTFIKQKIFLNDWYNLKCELYANNIAVFLQKWWTISTKTKLCDLDFFLNEWWQKEETKKYEMSVIVNQKQLLLKDTLFKNNFLDLFWTKRSLLRELKKATTPDINLFKILRIGSIEIRHSNFLSWLFDNNETHLHGSLFLELFLSCAEPIFENQSDLSELIKPELSKKYDVRREYKDIDVSLVFSNSYIIVENKIKHTLQEHQPGKYENIALHECEKLGISRDRIFFILLSVNKDKIEYLKNISIKPYTINYIKFFQKLKSNFVVIKSSYLKKILNQYIDTLSKITIKGV
jgi:hypothetical protein